MTYVSLLRDALEGEKDKPEPGLAQEEIPGPSNERKLSVLSKSTQKHKLRSNVNIKEVKKTLHQLSTSNNISVSIKRQARPAL